MGQQIKITHPGGNVALHKDGTSVKEALALWNAERLKETVAAKVNGLPVDLSHAWIRCVVER
jgi:hypothetical protein